MDLLNHLTIDIKGKHPVHEIGKLTDKIKYTTTRDMHHLLEMVTKLATDIVIKHQKGKQDDGMIYIPINEHMSNKRGICFV